VRHSTTSAVRGLVALLVVTGASLAAAAPAGAAPNRPPIAIDDAYTVHQGSTITVLAPGVLRNDSDPDGNALRVVDVSGGRGRLTLQPDGSVVYTSSYPYQRTDTWHVTIADSLGSQATSLLTFTLTNVKPVTAPDSYRVGADSALAVPMKEGVLANDSDPDGDPLKADLVGSTQHGQVRLTGTGDFQYVPDKGFVGTDTFVYRADDLADTSGPELVTITVIAPYVAPLAVNDEYAVPVNGTLSILAPGVLANDAGVVTASLVTGTAHGTLTLHADGSFTYVPATDFSGTDGFTYQAADAAGAQSGSAQVTITVALGVTPGASGGTTGGTAGGATGSSVTGPLGSASATPGTLASKPRLTLSLGAHRRAKSPKITVTAIVRNVSILNGPVKVTHVAPKGSRVEAVVSPRFWTCKTKGRTTTCRLPNMTSGVSAHFSFRLRLVKASAKAGKSKVTASIKAVGWPVSTVTHRIGA
jgi:hypothetical protein